MPRYPEVRKVLSAPYSRMSSEQIERMMESYNVNTEDMENFLSTLGNIGRGIMGILPTALPMVGTVLGGPLGGMLGGVAGQALGSLMPGQRPAPGQPQPLIGGPGSIPGQPMPAPAQVLGGLLAPSQFPGGVPAPAQIPGGSPAAGQLLQTMFRPETLQALISMLLGQAGQQSVPVGNTQVPNGGFANLLSVLANQAASEHAANVSHRYSGESIPAYMQNYAGEAYGDPAIPEARAEALLALLESSGEQDESSAPPRARPRYSFHEADESDEGTDEALYDEMDLNELYGEYEFA